MDRSKNWKNKMDGSSTEFVAKGNFPSCTIYKRRNHQSKDSWYKGKPQIQCNNCKKWGYKERYCHFKYNQSHPQTTDQVNFTNEQSEAREHLFMATQACSSGSNDVWYVDSGCTM